MATDVRFVSWLQQRLSDLGYKVNVTGRNDAATQAAIRQIQESLGVRATGTATREFMDGLRSLRMASKPATMPSGDTVPMPKLRPRPLASNEEMPMPRLRPRTSIEREPIGDRATFPMPRMRPAREQLQPMAARGMVRPPMSLEASGAVPSRPPPHASVNMVPASGPLSQAGNREMLSRALNMPMPAADASPAAGAIPPALGAPVPDAGLPLGAPPGVPLTGPGGSPAPQYQQNLWTELFRQVPGYQQQPMIEPTTGNSPLAGVEQYQTDAPPMQPPMPPVPQPQGMPLAAFQMRHDPNAMNAAGMMPPGMSDADIARRLLLQRLLQIPGQ